MKNIIHLQFMYLERNMAALLHFPFNNMWWYCIGLVRGWGAGRAVRVVVGAL
jgi:hypothetical protein